MTLTLHQFKTLQRAVWASGDYDAMAEQYEGATKQLVDLMDVRPGERVLDVATGTGNAAIEAARAGGSVVGVDITPELFDIAQARADEELLSVEWCEGDAEEIPYPDGSFDVVLSTFGVMFAPQHRRAAAELHRVLRPGGRLGLLNWVSSGIIAALYEIFDEHMPPLPPFAAHPRHWGDAAYVEQLFTGLDLELEFQQGAVPWVFSSPEDGMRWMEEVAGPVIATKALLETTGAWPVARARIVDELATLTREDIGGCWIRPEYLIVLGRRAG